MSRITLPSATLTNKLVKHGSLSHNTPLTTYRRKSIFQNDWPGPSHRTKPWMESTPPIVDEVKIATGFYIPTCSVSGIKGSAISKSRRVHEGLALSGFKRVLAGVFGATAQYSVLSPQSFASLYSTSLQLRDDSARCSLVEKPSPNRLRDYSQRKLQRIRIYEPKLSEHTTHFDSQQQPTAHKRRTRQSLIVIDEAQYVFGHRTFHNACGDVRVDPHIRATGSWVNNLGPHPNTSVGPRADLAFASATIVVQGALR
ncbi:hypothetical protein BDN72DRAFT_857560 [Pluteus cervinus]|uniref:Uncharacterized protein n=1 Tax=Pluteus cervinus TaxID=181527 RepID=A0ACD3AVL0_9AGAR|nr:hypothetical protein BDN72DRAFT_857560 [Pluteus cervinus]